MPWSFKRDPVTWKLALSPKLRAAAAVSLVKSFGSEGIVVSSGAGDGAHDILALPHTASVLEKQGLSAAIIRRVLCENALAFFKIDRKSLDRE
jgi:predicted metal-dependent TIM-barrel fold hydrolase